MLTATREGCLQQLRQSSVQSLRIEQSVQLTTREAKRLLISTQRIQNVFRQRFPFGQVGIAQAALQPFRGIEHSWCRRQLGTAFGGDPSVDVPAPQSGFAEHAGGFSF